MSFIGVTVIAGFLGSGKTTLLRRVVRDERFGKGVAVIINELGALGLDQELVRSEETTATMYLRQLVSGCICCSLRGDLLSALQEIASGRDRPPPRHILVETSGAARASEVSYAINAIGFEAPFRTDSVLTLVDVHSAARAYREHEDLFEDQLRVADVLLLNKSDLLEDEHQREVMRSWIATMAPRATLIWTVEANIDPALLLEPDSHGYEDSRISASSANEEVDHRRDHQGGRAHGLESLTLAVPRPLNRNSLENLFESLADRIFRIKGVVDVLDGSRRSPLLVQVVGDRIEMDEIAQSSPLIESRRRLIFIGTELDEAYLRSALVEVEGTG